MLSDAMITSRGRSKQAKIFASLILFLIILGIFGAQSAKAAPVPAGLTASEWHSIESRIAAQVTAAPLTRSWGQEKLTLPGTVSAGDNYGGAVDISGDTLIVGVPDANNHVGAAYVFTRSSGVWSQQAVLTAAAPVVNGHFGASVAIDGTYIVVGGLQNDHTTLYSNGSVYGFVGAGAVWVPSPGGPATSPVPFDSFGASVDVSGNVVIVGAPSDSIFGTSKGAAYIVTLPSPTPTRIMASDAVAGDNFGVSVAVDGTTAVVGAWDHNSKQGKAYVFTAVSSWSEKAMLTAASGAAGDNFGTSVAIDAGTIIVGAPNTGATDAGAAYVFTGSEAAWTEQASLTAATPVVNDHFGISVAIDGDFAVVGALNGVFPAFYANGSVYLFEGSGSTWDQTQMLDSGLAADSYSASVAIDGETAVVGAPFHNEVIRVSEGAAYIISTLPVANDDPSYTTDEDTALTVAAAAGVLTNDSSSTNGIRIAEINTQPLDGAVALAADGGFVFTPALNFNGVTTFTYGISNTLGTGNTAVVTVTVGAVNDAPVAVDDTATTDEDMAVTISVMGNDSDIDSMLTIDSIGAVSSGAATISGTDIEYTPVADFNGTATFTYVISDGMLTDTAMVTVTVSPINDAPVAVDDTAVTDEDVAVTISVMGNDSDIDSTINIDSISAEVNGTAVISGTDIQFVPDLDFNGTASFTYVISDGVLTDSADVVVTVNVVNDAPVAVDDAVTTDEDTPFFIDILGNDSDVDDVIITIDSISAESNGTAVVTARSGGVVFVPDADFNGTGSFTYVISDGVSTASAEVIITINPINDAPIAVDDTAMTVIDSAVEITVLGNDTDKEGSLTVSGLGAVPNGTATTDGTTITFTPASLFLGTSVFTYTVTDIGDNGAASLSAVATVTVTTEVVPTAVSLAEYQVLPGYRQLILPLAFVLIVIQIGLLTLPKFKIWLKTR